MKSRPSRLLALTLPGLLVASGLVGVGLAAAPAAAAPVADVHYAFDDDAAVGAGATLHDAGTGARHATVVGTGASLVPGVTGTPGDLAIELPGGANTSGAPYVQLPAGLVGPGQTDLTIAGWVRWDGARDCTWPFALGRDSTSYVFATPRCGAASFGAIKQGTEQRSTAPRPLVADRWEHVAVVLDGGTDIAYYLNGTEVARSTTAHTAEAALGAAAASGYLGRSLYAVDPLFGGAIDEVQVFASALAPGEVAALGVEGYTALARADLDAIELGDTADVRGDLPLPATGSNGASITWTSSHPDVVTSSGTVRRPAPGSPDVTVTLTPAASLGGVEIRGDAVDVVVRAFSTEEITADLRSRLVVPPIVGDGYSLPPVGDGLVVWSAEPATAVVDGMLVNDDDAALDVEVTASAAVEGDTLTKQFSVKVLPQDGSQALLAYTRTPTSVDQANHQTVARSLHLALGDHVETAEPLNENGGVLFASSVFTGVDLSDLRALRDPSLFWFADGTLGVIATRVEVDGSSDGTRTSQALVFRSQEPGNVTDFRELGLVDLGTTAGINDPVALYDSAEDRYLVSWTTDAGRAQHVLIEDLGRTASVPDPHSPYGGRRTVVATDGNRDQPRDGAPITTALAVPDDVASRIADAEPTNAITVPATAADALRTRFGRITNTAVTVPDQEIAPGATGALQDVRATLTYSDGSTAQRAVTWDADQLAGLADAGPGTYTLDGRIKQTRYPRQFAHNRADPTIYRYTRDAETTYLFIATDDTNNDNVGSTHLPIRAASSIEALADVNGGRSLEVDLLNRLTRAERNTQGRTIAGCYWAPEIHEIGGRLSILFAPCFNENDSQANSGGSWRTVQAHIMQLEDGGDPANPDHWSTPAPILDAAGNPLGRPGFAQNISLDMTYVEAGGEAYYAWSQRYVTPGLSDPATWIAKVDPADPTRITTTATPIIVPTLTFEDHLSEGAFPLHHDGKIYLTTSGSGVSPTYIVGGVWADEDADLTDIHSWHKYGAPLQKSEPMVTGVDYGRYEQGPGHGSFTWDEDDNLLYVYHRWGNGTASGDGRDTEVRRVHWAADGQPILDMTYAEELDPELADVQVKVKVSGEVPTVDLDVDVSPRCLAGKTYIAVRATNAGSVPADLTLTTPFGEKSFTDVAPGRNAYQSFPTRATSVEAGTVAVTGTAVLDGTPVDTVYDVAFDARTCG
ncbi:family 43 glycosylhydrolase [Cellulosimicrobium cellulans]|uniref:LamG-like jellyroll fold domain-containing protein n=1 Tax=Cellulosimicrobium cellulans TaxID=1710 RepID=UPI0019653803|nr:LamG-like jellyroll fold domain-containing protein [Cellulosimicrobium cellulans]MBN0038578.1 family 43 glycosylhydrolase [Cellulosimicrobium cellulans]